MAVYNSMKDYQKKLKRWVKDYPQDVERAMGEASEVVRGEVITRHLNGPRMPKGVGSKTKGTLQPRTGKLKNSITTKVFKTAGSIKAYVGNLHMPLKYAARHEYGDAVMPERSFLRSSLSEKRKKIKEILLDAMKRSYDNA